MTSEEMNAMNEARNGNRLFSRDAESAEKIAAIVAQTRSELQKMPERVSLGDVQTIRQVLLNYLKSCERVAVCPSKSGLCRALGITRQAVDDYMKRHPEAESSQLLAQTFDAFADVLANAALAGATHPIFSIFVEKAVYGMRDTQTIEIRPANSPLGEETDYADLEKRIDDTVIID